MNNSGKIMTIFIVVIFVVLICLTGISSFFFLEEVKLRKAAEFNLEQMKTIEANLQSELKETKKKVFLLEEKNKEANEKIEGLVDDLEFEKEVKDAIKEQNRELKESLEKAKQAQENIQNQLNAQLAEAEGKINSLKKELESAVTRNNEFEQNNQDLQNQYNELKDKLTAMGISDAGPSDVQTTESTTDADVGNQENVQLEKIVVVPSPSLQKGTIVSIDKDTNFIIIKYGEADGIKKGSILSIYRGENYLGDVQVSRVISEMSAADFIPPLTSQDVQKDDRVVIKQ